MEEIIKYEGPKMPEKVEKLNVKIVKDFLKSNNIDSENPKIQELIKWTVEVSTDAEDSLKTLYAYLSRNSLILKQTKKSKIKDKKVETTQKVENKVSEKNKAETKKVEVTLKQKEILNYTWKKDDFVEFKWKKYTFESVKKYLSDGKDWDLTNAFYKKLQDLKWTKIENPKVLKSKDWKITISNDPNDLPEKKIYLPSEQTNVVYEPWKVKIDWKTVISSDPNDIIKTWIDLNNIDNSDYLNNIIKTWVDYNDENNIYVEKRGINLDYNPKFDSEPQVQHPKIQYPKIQHPKPTRNPNDYTDWNYHIKKDNNWTTLTYKDWWTTAVSSIPKWASWTICVNWKCITQ